MQLTKDTAKLIDDILRNAIIKHESKKPNDPNFQLIEYTKSKPDGMTYAIEELQDAMAVASQFSEKYQIHSAFSYNGSDNITITLEKLRPFLRFGGFTSIWTQEEDERLFKKDVKLVNDSVKETNTFTRRVGWISLLFIGLSTYYQATDNTPEEIQRLRDILSSSTKYQDSIRISLEEINASIRKLRIDTVPRH